MTSDHYDVIFLTTPLQFILENEDAYRAYWRTTMQRMTTLRQRMHNRSLDLFRRMEAAVELMRIDNELKEIAALTGPQPVTKEPPAIIYRLPDLDPTLVLYNRVTRHWKPRPPFEPLAGWVHALEDNHPLRIAAGSPPPQEACA